MGLVARHVEAAGIPTLCMTSAQDITRAVNPPRAAFLDFPLGHTTGKPHEPDLQRRILVQALSSFGGAAPACDQWCRGGDSDPYLLAENGV